MRDRPLCGIDQELEPSRDAPRAARHAVRPLGERLLPEWRRADLDLLVTELVSNSLLHARPGPIAVRASPQGDGVRVEVWDEGPGIGGRAVAMPMPAAHRGRGLPLVDHLSDRWGSTGAAGRSCVWFEMGPEPPLP